jgi:ankyrin repeat protein
MNLNENLFNAISRVNRSSAASLIAAGANINGRTELGEGVWSFVVPLGIRAVDFALEFGANPNFLDAADRSPLYWAVQANAPDIACRIIDAGGRMDEGIGKDKFNVIHDAAQAGYETVLSVLARRASLDLLKAENVMERTPLDEASAAGHTNCSRILAQEIARKEAEMNLKSER